MTWSQNVATGLGFIQNSVLQIPLFLMTMMRNITPTLDDMWVLYFQFVSRLNAIGLWNRKPPIDLFDLPWQASRLAWVDSTYYKKHEKEISTSLRNSYYENLRKYPTKDIYVQPKSAASKFKTLIMWSGKKAGLSLMIFILSYTPVVGRFVLPGASFYTFQKVIGLAPASLIFGVGIFLPRTYLVVFLQSYFASRNLMRELVGHLTSKMDRVTKMNSLSLIFAVYVSQKNKRRTGFMIVKGFFLDLELDFTCSSVSHS